MKITIGKKTTVECMTGVLVQVIEDDLAQGLCCNIDFTYRGKKHQIGVYGDNGNTYSNVKYYFDKSEYDTKDEMLQNAWIDGINILAIQDKVLVTECDGCYPDSTPIFKELMNQQ